MERDKEVGITGENQPKILVTPDSAVLPFAESHFFDESMLKKESEALTRHIVLARESLGQPFVGSPKDAARWHNLQSKVISSRDLSSAVNEELDQVQLTPGEYTQVMLSRIEGVSLGVALLRQSAIRGLLALSKKYNFEDKYTPLAQLMEFSAAAKLTIRVGSVALQDFVRINKKNTIPTPYYQFLIEAGSSTEGSRQQIFEQNQDYPKNLYPNRTKQAIIDMGNSLISILNSEVITAAGSEDPIIKESVRLFSNLVKGAQDVREKTYQSVLNPKSENFSDLSDLVGQYLGSQDKRTRMLAFYQMNIDTKQRIIEAYRKARKYEIEDNNGEFYMIFCDSIGEYMDEVSPFINILTDEDVVEILDNDIIQSTEEKSVPTFDQLGKRVNDIFNKTSKKDFAIEPCDINWSQLHVPEEVKINFDSNRPRIFTMKITFNNDLGESTEVECSINTVKNFMDWNHPEDPMLLPKNSDLMAFRRSLMLAAQSILDNVYRQAQEEYQSRRASQTAPLPVETRRPKRERVQDPVYELRKTARAQQQVQSASTIILFEALSSKEEIKNRVILPSDEEFEDMVRYLSHVDRDIVRKSIEEYNEKGTGAKFTRKKRVGAEGALVYGLSIGCSVPKGARVLLREVESVNDGTRNFEVIDIRYRKDIYPKNKL